MRLLLGGTGRVCTYFCLDFGRLMSRVSRALCVAVCRLRISAAARRGAAAMVWPSSAKKGKNAGLPACLIGGDVDLSTKNDRI